MKQSLIVCLAFVFFSSAAAQNSDSSAGIPSAEETQKNIAVLQDIFQNKKLTDEHFFAASQAVQALTETGTADAVPELAKLLAFEQMNTIARTALVNMPQKAGIAALREALVPLQGKNLAGVIDSLGSERDTASVPAFIKLAGNTDAVVAQAAVSALGKTATPEAVVFLQNLLSPKSEAKSEIKHKAAHALLNAADRLLADGKKEEAQTIYVDLQHAEGTPNVQIQAATCLLLLQDEDAGLRLTGILLKSDFSSTAAALETAQWEVVRGTVNRFQSPKTSQMILDNFGKQPNDRKAVLLEIIGNRKDPGIVEAVIKFAEGNEPLTKIAAVNALGKLGDIKGLDTILKAAVSDDADLAAAGNRSLLMLQGKEFNAAIIKLLHSPQTAAVRLAALNVVAGRGMIEAKECVRPLLDHSDPAVRLAAYKAFAQIAGDAADFVFLLDTYNKAVGKPAAEVEELKASLKVICEKTPERGECAAVLSRLCFDDNVHPKAKPFFLELLMIIGSEQAGKAVVRAAKSSDTAVADKATEILGKWRTGEIADDLYEIAQTHPVEKFRQRAVSGYIRIIRQLSGHLPPEKQLEMIAKAEKIAVREEHKTILAAAKERVLRLSSKGTPLFDGKTFDNWEFRSNKDWFRIEDGAIVAGSLKKPVPQNEFICTQKEYGDFTLRLEIKILDSGETGGGEANAGVQFRSQRMPPDSKKPNEVIGYQADMTATEKFWGSLYDESRRGKFLAEANREEMKQIFRPNDWNEMEIVCKGANVKIFVNGKQTIDFTETDANIPRKGIIGLQIHSARPSEAWYRNIRIEEQ